MRQLRIAAKSITNRNERSVDRYLSEVNGIPMVDVAEEIFLAKKIQQGDLAALQKLTNANLRFVISVAKQYQNQGLTLGDLINEGNWGLIKAAKRFDESKGFKFISYAVWWIRQSIMQAIAEQGRIVRLPLNQVGSMSKLKNAIAELEHGLEREPTIEELAENMSVDVDKIVYTMAHSHYTVSLDAPFNSVHATEHDTLLDITSNGDLLPDQPLLDDSLKYEIEKSLKVLTKNELQVIEGFYGLNGKPAETMESLGDKMKFTRERIRQIREIALKKLRVHAKKSPLKGYL